MSTTTLRTKLSVPQLAEKWGISPNKVLAWIRAGELRAVNIAMNRSGDRPRYVIDVADIEAFEQSREARPARRARTKPRSRATMKVESFI
jgi:hypothetical protein